MLKDSAAADVEDNDGEDDATVSVVSVDAVGVSVEAT